VAYELESELEAAGKHALIDLVRSIKPDDMDCAYVRQPRALGLGHAVLCAKSLVGNEPFAVLLADDLMVGTPSITAQLVAAYQATGSSVLAVQEVPMQDTRKYGVVAPKAAAAGAAGHAIQVPHGQLIEIAGLVEKPQPHVAPSNLAVAGRYVLTPAVFDRIASQPRGVGGEIQLTDGIAGLLANESVYALRYQGQRYDCGSKLGFLQATVDLAKQHPEVGADFTEWMKAQHCLEQR
jgi:UTP--glucose-1-phosphate uridylyltransferase